MNNPYRMSDLEEMFPHIKKYLPFEKKAWAHTFSNCIHQNMPQMMAAKKADERVNKLESPTAPKVKVIKKENFINTNLFHFNVLNEALKYGKDEFTARFDKIYIENEEVNSIQGGLGDSSTPQDFDYDQLKDGTKIEFEHADDIKIAMEIACDHLTEDPHYYEKLATIEND